MNPVPRLAFGYTHGGEKDSGWGCVYRSVQNVQAYTGVPVNTVRELAAIIRRPWKTWSEPADFTALFRAVPGFRVSTLLLGGPSRQWLKYTSSFQYDRHIAVASDFKWNTQASYVVDNGRQGYAVVSADNKHWFIDPHTPWPVPVPFVQKRHLSGARGWMLLEVLPLLLR